MRKSNEATTPVTPAGMWSWDGQGFDAIVKTYESWAKDWGALQDESLRFLRHRLERSVEAATSIASCKSPGEALEMQMRYAGDTFNDYMSEGQKMMTLVSHAPSIAVP